MQQPCFLSFLISDVSTTCGLQMLKLLFDFVLGVIKLDLGGGCDSSINSISQVLHSQCFSHTPHANNPVM
jgi:hypothetical protein